MLLHLRCSYCNRRWVLIVIRNNDIYIYMCVCLCVYTLQVITLTMFWLGWLFVFVSIKSNSFDVKSLDFYLLKIWIYELLLINIKQRSVQQSTISAHEYWAFSEEIFIVFVSQLLLLKTLKKNGILLSQFAQNVVEALFLSNIANKLRLFIWKLV